MELVEKLSRPTNLNSTKSYRASIVLKGEKQLLLIQFVLQPLSNGK